MTKKEPTAKQINTHHSIIAKYKRDEVKPSIDVAIKLANVLNTTVGYLLGENEDKNVLQDPTMLKRLNVISTLPDDDKHCIIYAIDGLLQNVRTKQAFE